MVYNILRDYKMLNAEVLFRDDEGMLYLMIRICNPANGGAIATVDDLIDVIMKDHRKYIRWYVHPFYGSSWGRGLIFLVYMPTTKSTA